MTLNHIRAALGPAPLALMPEKIAELQALMESEAVSRAFASGDMQAALRRRQPNENVESAGNGTIAILPLIGVCSQRGSILDAIFRSGSVPIELFGAQLRQVVSDPNCRSIIIEIDSPGGSSHGIQELANEIYRARSRKPIVAVVNSLAASAAYWVASAASEIVLTPSGYVGSIGVYSQHTDVSEALNKAGIRQTFISAGTYKTEGNPYEPLSQEGRDYEQKIVNECYAEFLAAVARGRKTTTARVRAEFGQGRCVGAREALRLGMVDRIGTMPDTINRMIGNASSGSPRQALAYGGMEASDLGADQRQALDDLRRRRALFRIRTST